MLSICCGESPEDEMRPLLSEPNILLKKWHTTNGYGQINSQDSKKLGIVALTVNRYHQEVEAGGSI